MENVGHHMNASVIPVDELSIVPNDVTNACSAYVFRCSLFWKHVLNSLSISSGEPAPALERNLPPLSIKSNSAPTLLCGTGHNSVNALALARRVLVCCGLIQTAP